MIYSTSSFNENDRNDENEHCENSQLDKHLALLHGNAVPVCVKVIVNEKARLPMSIPLCVFVARCTDDNPVLTASSPTRIRVSFPITNRSFRNPLLG